MKKISLILLLLVVLVAFGVVFSPLLVSIVSPMPAQEVVVGVVQTVTPSLVVVTGPEHSGPTIFNKSNKIDVAIDSQTQVYAASTTSASPQPPPIVRARFNVGIVVSGNLPASNTPSSEESPVSISQLAPGMYVSVQIEDQHGVLTAEQIYITSI